MAGDWIKMRTNLDTDPAVVRISSGLKTDRFGVVGRLHKIWAWANEHLTDGVDVPIDAEFLDSLVETPGFSAELRRVGWLSGRDGCLIFPGFEKHNGASAKSRAQDALRKKQSRKTSEKCPVANGTKSGLEKRREEKSNTHNSGDQFCPPTVDQVSGYSKEVGATIDPQRFVDFYTSKGWMVGENKMEDWRAAVRGWKRDRDERGRSSPKTFEQIKIANTRDVVERFRDAEAKQLRLTNDET